MYRRHARVVLVVLPVLLATSVPSADGGELRPVRAAEAPLRNVSERIANGTLTTLPPSVAWLLTSDALCTGTLIGCRTILSAAHCFCAEDETGETCEPTNSGVVFFQHAPTAVIASVDVHPEYEFGVASDLAVVHLQQPVTGIRPAALNTAGKPAPGTEGLIVGFGTDSEDQGAVNGLKRSGLVTTGDCPKGISDATHLCWSFEPPPGPPGEDSNTCSGDSGGPLFVDFGSGPVLAGVTSGGTGPCDGSDVAFDADVYHDRMWVQQRAGLDLGQTCGDWEPAGSPGSPILVANGTLNDSSSSATYAFDIPPGTELLRVTLNGPLVHDFDLYVGSGSQAGPGNALCESEEGATLEFCQFAEPTVGTWRAQVARFEGSGPFQLTTTLFGAQKQTAEDCVADTTTLCIDDAPGDARFRVTMEYESTLGGGIQGDALVTPLASVGITRGGVLAFTNRANPEVLVKVLNGCSINDHYWVFYAAATTVGFRLTVDDTEAQLSKTYVNPDRTQALTITDTLALATCP